MPLQIIRQDITIMDCDAIVNPSNEDLCPGGGTDAAIHKAAGSKLMLACRQIGGINLGEAVITPAFDLPCKYVIHTAGPWWEGGDKGETALLASCYKNALDVAKEKDCESIAFPLISAGLYGFPKDKVLEIAIRTVSEFLFYNEMTVYLVVFDKRAYELSERLFSGIREYIDDCYVLEHCDNERDNKYIIDSYSKDALSPICCRSIADFDKCSPVSEKNTSIDKYIKLDDCFSVKLLKLIDAKNMDDVECYKKANVSKQTWYKIMNDKSYKPNKKTVISFSVALGLTLDETQNLLESVGFVLSNSSLFDVIIMYCIENEIYSVHEIDAILFKYDQETLYSKL